MLRSLMLAIEDHDAVDVEVVVVDDGGGGVRAAVVAWLGGATPRIVETKRSGRSAARNTGARASSGDRILFLDDDVIVDADVLDAHAAGSCDAVLRGTIRQLPWLAAFEDPVGGELTERARASLPRNGMSGIVERRLRIDDRGRPTAGSLRRGRLSAFERDLHRHLDGRGAYRAGRWIASTGANLSMSREAFDAVGGFDERMGVTWGAEDLELGYRCEKLGLAVRHAQRAVAHHMDHAREARDGEHASALTYFATKHHAPNVLLLQSYFAGQCAIDAVVGAGVAP